MPLTRFFDNKSTPVLTNSSEPEIKANQFELFKKTLDNYKTSKDRFKEIITEEISHENLSEVFLLQYAILSRINDIPLQFLPNEKANIIKNGLIKHLIDLREDGIYYAQNNDEEKLEQFGDTVKNIQRGLNIFLKHIDYSFRDETEQETNPIELSIFMDEVAESQKIDPEKEKRIIRKYLNFISSFEKISQPEDENDKEKIINLLRTQHLKILPIIAKKLDYSLLPKMEQVKFRSELIPELMKIDKESISHFQKKDFNSLFESTQQTHSILKRIAILLDRYATEKIKNKVENKELLEITDHVEHLVEMKQRVKKENAKRKRYKIKKEAIKNLIIQMLDDEKNISSQARHIYIDKLQQRASQNQLITTSQDFTVSAFTDSVFEESADIIRNLDRSDILDLDKKQPIHIDAFKSYAKPSFYENNYRDISDQDRNKINRREEVDFEKNKYRLNSFLNKPEIKKYLTNPDYIPKLLRIIKNNDITCNISTLLEIITENEYDLIEAEKGVNYLDLYRKTFLESDFFHKEGAESFMGIYMLVVSLGLFQDDDYDPLTLARKFTQETIVAAYGLRRASDPEINAGKRNIIVEEVSTYKTWILSYFKDSGMDLKDQEENISNLIAKFWWNEVGRPSIKYLKNTDDQFLEDEYGPRVEKLENQENVSYPVSKEHGKYFLRKNLTEKAREILQQNDQLKFAAATVYFQLHSMVNERRKKENTEVGKEDVPLPERKSYYITHMKGQAWKKIKVDGKFFTTDAYGARGSQEALEKFIIHYSKQVDEDINKVSEPYKAYNQFSTNDLRRLQKQADRAYNTKRLHREKYQDNLGKIEDPFDFTASDIGICFVDDSITNDANQVMQSMLASTFGGKKQLNLLFGTDENGYVTQVGETVSHKFLDGAPARIESRKVVSNSVFALDRLDNKAAEPIENSTDITDFKERSQQRSIIHEGKIKKEKINLRDRSNNIFSFYSEKLGISIDKNTIVQLAVHSFLNLSHTHFLESNNGSLAPALSFCPKETLNKIKSGNLGKDDLLQLLASTQVLRADRKSVKAGKGMIATSAMLSGAHSASAGLRKIIQTMGETLHGEVTKPLSRSVLVSSVSGSRKPFPKDTLDDIAPQDCFTTALDGVYLDYGSFGFNDVGDDISVTYRQMEKNKTEIQDFNKEFNDVLNNILITLENGMEHFSDEEEFTGQTWAQIFAKKQKK